MSLVVSTLGRARCEHCAAFLTDGAELERALPGLRSLGSGYGATRAGDGLCRTRERFVAARDCCPQFAPQAAGR